MNTTSLSWEWFDQAARGMAQQLRARLGEGMPDGLIVLGRGGMVLGSRLSHLLNLPVAGAVIMSRFKNPSAENTDPPVDGVVVSPYVLARRGPVLLVDNIISEGVTLQLASAALEKAGVAPERVVVCALLARAQHAPEGIIGERVPDPETWYIFPWETRPS